MSRVEAIAKDSGHGYFKKILFFAIPLMITGILQSLYSAADLIVVGRFEGELALAAVGSTGSLTNLILGLFMGLSVGAGVCVAHGVGAKRFDDVEKTLHTAIATALMLGTFIGIVGFILAPQMLHVMDTPDDVLDMASLYIRIIFLGAPAAVLYNYCAAMLRAIGDSKRPLFFLAVSGLLNVALNLILVAGLGMGVAGVAIGTIASQFMSAVLIIIYMYRTDGCLRFSPQKLKIHKDKLSKILKIGIPSGIQGSLFSFSNVIIQSSINSFGSAVVSGSSAAANIENFYYVAYNAFYQGTLTFVGQSVGAEKFGHIKKIVLYSILNMLMFAVVLTGLGIIFKDQLLGLYLPDSPEALQAASVRFLIIVSTQFLAPVMEIGSGTLRGMGRSISSAVISLIGACVFRIVWLSTVFEQFRTPECIYIAYPISWLLTATVLYVCAFFAVKKEMRHHYLHDKFR
jgi:putative MATE family efflux protein